MYLTNRDKEIMIFIEKYGSITITQCAKIFFTKNKQSYYQARRRLKLLSDNNFLKRYRKDMKSETIYYLEKKLSVHDLKTIDVYAEIINLGAHIDTFEKEYRIILEDKEYRADALIECIKDDYFFPILVEIDHTHFTSNKKLLDIYNSNYFQNKYKNLDNNIFPTILIVKPFVSSTNSDLPFDIIYTDYTLNNIIKIFN